MADGIKAGTAFIEIKGDWNRFNRDMDSSLGAAGGKFGKFGGKAKMAAAGVAAVGAAAVVAGKKLYDIGAQFDDAYDTIRVGTGATGKQLDGLKDDFKSVVKTVPTDFKSASTAIADLNTRLGLSGKPLRAMSTRVLELSRITGTDVKQNVESVTRVFGDWGVAIKDQPGNLDKLFRASQATGIEVSKLSDMMVRYGAPLRQLGFDFDQAAGLIGKFEKEGVNTQLVMGSMRIALGKLAKQGKDPVKAFGEITDQIKTAGSTAEANKLALEVFGARAGPDMAAAIREGRFDLGELYNTISNGEETILKAGKDTQDFGEKWQLLKNRVLVGLEPLAMKVFDAMGAGMDLIVPATQRVSRWVSSLRGVFQGTGESSDRLRTILTSLRNALQGVVDISVAIGKIATAAWEQFGDLVIDRAQNMLAFVVAFTDGVLEAIGGLIDLVAGVLTGDWSRAWGGIKAIVSGTWKAMVAIVKAAWNELVIAVRLGMRLVVLAIQGFASVLVGLGKWIVNRIVDGIKAMASALVGAAGWIKNRVVEAIQARASDYLAIGRWVINRIADGVTTITTALAAVGGWIKNRITDLVRATAEGLVGLGRWVINRIMDGVLTVTDAVKSVGGWLRNRVVEFVGMAKDGFMGVGRSITGWIVEGLKKGIRGIVGFVNAIIGVINKIPGVDVGKVKVDDVPGLAKGGVVGHEQFAKGGKITRPMVVVGEEAPRHDEYVIPTNPAYRGRAVGLFGDLGQRLGIPGFAAGGVFRATSYGPPWNAMNGSGVTATGVDLRPAKPAYGIAVDPGVIPLGSNVTVNPNPFGYGGKFKAFDTGGAIKGNRVDIYDWRGRGAQLAWGSRSVKVGGAMSASGEAAVGKNPAGFNPLGLVRGLIGKLPNPSEHLPDWMQGTGKWALDKVKKWMRGKAASLNPFGGGGGGIGDGDASWGLVEGLAGQLGLTMTSGYRHGDPGLHGRGRARDYSNSTGPTSQMMTFAQTLASSIGSKLLELIYSPLGWGIKNGKKVPPYAMEDHYNHVHVGMAKGGVLGPGGVMPFVGSYRAGGVVPMTGMAHVHRGETITPAGVSPEIRVFIGDQELKGMIRVEMHDRDRQGAGAYRAGVLA